MPFVSKAQQKWMFINKPEMAKRWAKETPDIKNLPSRKKRKVITQAMRDRRLAKRIGHPSVTGGRYI